MTRVLTLSPDQPDPAQVEEAARILRDGGLVAFPTETVYGLGASVQRPEAIARLAALKGRSDAKPFTYHVASREDLMGLTGPLPEVAQLILERYAPGPITLVVPSPSSPTGTIGVRVPAHPIAERLIRAVGAPLLVPSANPAGAPPAIDGQQALAYFEGAIDAVIDGGPVTLKQSSTVLVVEGSRYRVLRDGFITREMIHQLVEGSRVLFVCTGNTCRSPLASAIYRKLLAEHLGKAPEDLEELGYRILSAGTFAGTGASASEGAVEAARRRGCDLGGHRSRQLTPELLSQADHVYAMTRGHLETVEEMLEMLGGDSAPKVELLGEAGIPDPVGGSSEDYEECATEIEAAIRARLPF